MLKREDITRERVEQLVAEAKKIGHFTTLTHSEREENRSAFLKDWPAGKDLWVFGYGSLIWNPAFWFAEKRPSRIFGYHRRFCLQLTIGRGSPQFPGLMLALDRGGSCSGLAFRIEARHIESETRILWMREMISGAYRPHWLNIHMADSVIPGFTFVVNHKHDRYIREMGIKQTAQALARGKGPLGSCREYLELTIEGLKEVNIHDSYLKQLQKALENL